MLISIETYRTCDFPGGGVRTPCPPPPLDPRMRMIDPLATSFSSPVKPIPKDRFTHAARATSDTSNMILDIFSGST